MISATFFFLALAVCIFAGLICYSLARSIKTSKAPEMPANEKAAWEQIKNAMYELHSRYESTETPKQKALRSWAGTLIICSGLCMIGILMEVEFDRVISYDSVFSGFLGEGKIRQCIDQCRKPVHHAVATPGATHTPAASKSETSPSKEPATPAKQPDAASQGSATPSKMGP
jgi:hypothetical protein